MNPLGIIVDIGCVNIVNKYQQKQKHFYISSICILHNIALVLIASAYIQYRYLVLNQTAPGPSPGRVK